MKNAKKFFAVLVVLALALSMVIPAAAADEKTITITGSIEGTEYKAYKMAELSYAGTAYSYTVADGWDDFFNNEKYKASKVYAVDPVTKVVTEKENHGVDMKEIAKEAVAYAIEKGISGFEAVANDKGEAVIEVPSNGYYCVDTNLGTLCTIDTYKGENVEISEKNSIPTLEKLVKEGNVFTSTSDGSVGDEVEFQITVTKSKGAENFKIFDDLGEGLEFASLTSVKINNQEDMDEEGYELAVNKDKHGFTIEFKNPTIDALDDGAKIIVLYKAIITPEAVVAEAGNENTAYLQYGPEYKTKESITKTYVWKFSVVKVQESEDGPVLSGAEFSLYKDSKCTEIMRFTGEEGKYSYNKEGEITVLKDDGNGSYSISGLDSGVYYLKETKAPAGFNKIPDAKAVTIDAESKNSVYTGTYTVDPVKNSGNYEGKVVIVNKTGSLLPYTGSTGKVVFITVGSVLVLVVGVLLIVRKRMTKLVYTK